MVWYGVRCLLRISGDHSYSLPIGMVQYYIRCTGYFGGVLLVLFIRYFIANLILAVFNMRSTRLSELRSYAVREGVGWAGRNHEGCYAMMVWYGMRNYVYRLVTTGQAIYPLSPPRQRQPL